MASIISYFKSYHYYLRSFIVITNYKIIFCAPIKKSDLIKPVFWLSVFGMFFTAIAGLIVEKWGTYNGYWVYLDIPENIEIPFWVPFAWGLAYKTLYKVELILTSTFSPHNGQNGFFVSCFLH